MWCIIFRHVLLHFGPDNVKVWRDNLMTMIVVMGDWKTVQTQSKHQFLLKWNKRDIKMYFFIKLQFVCFITLLLLIAELTLDHFTHSLTLLVVAWQTLYNFLSLFISSVSLALTHNNSRELEQKVNIHIGYWKYSVAISYI